jgi:hypothetical protein
MPDLSPEVERQLANMSDTEFAALTARLRCPDSIEQLRAIAAKTLQPEQVESWMFGRDPSAFTNANGEIDEAAAVANMIAVHGASVQQQQQPQPQVWGRDPEPVYGPGAGGRIEAAKRFGKQAPTSPPKAQPAPASTHTGPGAAGAAAAARRFNNNNEGSR